MNQYVSIVISILMFLAAQPALSAPDESGAGTAGTYRKHDCSIDGKAGSAQCCSDGSGCNSGMRGRCGKKRGDWYGARQAVSTSAEALELINNYFAGQEYTVGPLTEKKWGYWAEITNKSGERVDRVMIDKRSGRIRSVY